MGQVLLWDGKRKKRMDFQAVLIDAFCRSVIFFLIPFFLVLCFFQPWLLYVLIGILFVVVFAVLWVFCDFIIIFRGVKPLYHIYCLTAINIGYYNSMQQALVTPYPHGVVYILENTLQHLKNFGINYLPSKSTCYLKEFEMIEHGWPNKTVLQEAIDIAKLVVKNWDNFEPAEQSSTMANIRQMIQPQVMYIQGKLKRYSPESEKYYYLCPNIKINQDHYSIDIYEYYYDEKDYRRETGNQPPKPDFPTTYQSSPQPEYEPTPQTQPEATQQVLTFREFLAQNTGLLWLSEAGQLEEYHKYLADMGIKPPSS